MRSFCFSVASLTQNKACGITGYTTWPGSLHGDGKTSSEYWGMPRSTVGEHECLRAESPLTLTEGGAPSMRDGRGCTQLFRGEAGKAEGITSVRGCAAFLEKFIS